MSGQLKYRELQKLAKDAVLELEVENRKLKEELDNYKESVKLAFELYDNGNLSEEMIQSKIEEFSNKSSNERDIIKEASAMSFSYNNIFSLSDEPDHSNSLNADERFESYLLSL